MEIGILVLVLLVLGISAFTLTKVLNNNTPTLTDPKILEGLVVVKQGIETIERNQREEFAAFRKAQDEAAASSRKELSDKIDILREELNKKLLDLATGNAASLQALTEEFRKNLETLNTTNTNSSNALVTVLKEGYAEIAVKQTQQTQDAKDALKELKELNIQNNIEVRSQLDISIKAFKETTEENLKHFTANSSQKIEALKETLNKQMELLNVSQLDIKERNIQNNLDVRSQIELSIKGFKETTQESLTSFTQASSQKMDSLKELLTTQMEGLNIRQKELKESTDKHLEEMRKTVDEKLQETLNARLTTSFESVTKQLESVQLGLGEMKNLANDVGGLKKVLSNVKTRGNFGEVQLSMILEQMLAPNQYKANVVTKEGSAERVEFVICLPGKTDNNEVWLPVDAKFPQDVFDNYQRAHEEGTIESIKETERLLETAIKKMAADISSKYINPPQTTDFAIMFLPVEAIYGEVLRRASLIEELRTKYKVIVTGPTTFSAILTSLQMGFRTLEIEKRSGQVWDTLSKVKKEFETFTDLLGKTEKNISSASENLSKLIGTRTNAINRALRGVETAEIGITDGLSIADKQLLIGDEEE